MFAPWPRCRRLSSTLFSTAFLQTTKAAGPPQPYFSLLWGIPHKEGGLGYFAEAKYSNHCLPSGSEAERKLEAGRAVKGDVQMTSFLHPAWEGEHATQYEDCWLLRTEVKGNFKPL